MKKMMKNLCVLEVLFGGCEIVLWCVWWQGNCFVWCNVECEYIECVDVDVYEV